MAETIVNLVLGKLADTVVQEALFLHGVRDKVKRVQRDLTWIQSFLKDADAKRHKNKRVKILVNEIQEVGYLIEDVLEKFLADIGGGTPEGLSNKLKKIGKLPVRMIAKHRVCSEIDYIHQRLCEIKENKEMYGIEGLEETSVEQPILPSVHPDIDELEVVGFEVDRKTIVDQLIDRNITRRSVISIVGTGGTGKSTLAKDVYKSADVKLHFDISMWLTISQEYNLIDILMKILKEIGSERQNEGEQYLITELNKCMTKKKYLVVLDDVWLSNNVWIKLQAALPDANNGSRVLITTRFIEIPEMADKISKPHEIQPLNEEDSKQLLLKKVFPNRFANECSNDLLPLVTEFTKKCCGWPLPLVLLGGILSRINPDYIKWKEVIENMDWQNMGSGVISTSYEDLPAVLKPCFMYFGVFPEDYQIKATTLIHLWIAEGFIPQDETKLLEDIAESYLEELAQRCMVQVSRRSCTGKIKYCHLHDLLRDLTIRKAKEDNFLMVVLKNESNLSCSTSTRRVAHHIIGNKKKEHASAKNVRSLINFEGVPNFNNFGKLRVLHINSGRRSIETDLMDSIVGLKAPTALKYFSFEKEFIPDGEVDIYSQYIKRFPLTYMKNLQTMRIWGSDSEFSPSLWDNKQLRHIIFYPVGIMRKYTVGTKGPPSAANLQNLLTLKGVRARQDWVIELPNFPNIRKLGIHIPKDVDEKALINLLSNLNHLRSLNLIMEAGKGMPFPYGISAFSNHNRLHSFSLVRGTWPSKEVGDCTLFPVPHLVKLKLSDIHFNEDPMLQLEKLPNLRVLKLSESYIAGKQIIFSRGGFGRLNQLRLNVFDLEELKIEEGAMPMLNRLVLTYCFELQIVPDIQYLVNLQELTVEHCNAIKSKLQGEDQWKIKHIPSVIFNIDW